MLNNGRVVVAENGRGSSWPHNVGKNPTRRLPFPPLPPNLQLLPPSRLPTRPYSFRTPSPAFPFLCLPSPDARLNFLRLIATTEQHVRNTPLAPNLWDLTEQAVRDFHAVETACVGEFEKFRRFFERWLGGVVRSRRRRRRWRCGCRSGLCGHV